MGYRLTSAAIVASLGLIAAMTVGALADEYDRGDSRGDSWGDSLGDSWGDSMGDSVPEFYLRGNLELTYIDLDYNSENLLSGWLDLGLKPQIGFGFDLGVDLFAIEDDTYSALYPAVSYGTEIGRFSAGIPRSVIDRGYIPRSRFAYSNLFDLEFKSLFGSYVGAQYLLGDQTPVGLRYDGGFGNTKVGASWHRIDDAGNDFDSYAVAFRHRVPAGDSGPDLKFFGGIEHLTDGSFDADIWRIGAQARWDRFKIAAKYLDFDSSVSAVELNTEFKITDALTANASFLQFDNFGSEEIYGLGFRYRFFENFYADATYLDTSGGGNDIFELGVGVRF